jgi:hypothetical protein
MAFQTSITRSPAVAVAGMLADTNDVSVDSKVAQASVAPGLAVCFHTGDNTDLVRAPAATGEVTTAGQLKGVTMFDTTALSNPYAAGDPMPILKQGVMWVIAEEVVTPLSPVFIRFAAGAGGTALGAFRASADTATAVQVPSQIMSYETTTTGVNQLVKVRVNIP